MNADQDMRLRELPHDEDIYTTAVSVAGLFFSATLCIFSIFCVFG